MRWQARALDEFDSAVQVARRDGVTLIGDGATDDRRVAHHPRCATLAAGLTYLTMGQGGSPGMRNSLQKFSSLFTGHCSPGRRSVSEATAQLRPRGRLWYRAIDPKCWCPRGGLKVR